MMALLFDWAGLSLLLALITLLIVVLVHMVGMAFGLQNFTMWAKSEYAQVAVSVLIVAFAAAMLTAGNSVTGHVTAAIASASGNVELEGAANGFADDPAKIAKAYLIQGPIQCQKNIFLFYFVRNLLFGETWSSISFNVGNVEGVSGAFFLSGFVSTAHYIAQNMVYLGVFNYIQYYLMQFSQYTMLQIFLPIGLALRAFPMTRGAGGLMIGIALGFAFVFPMSYVLIVAMMPPTHFACTQVQVAVEAAPQYPEGDPCYNNAGAQLAALYGRGQGMNAAKNATYQSSFSWASPISSSLSIAEDAVKQIYMQAMFYPMIALIITFTFVRQTSSLFGADLAEIGRGLIKII